MLFHTFNSQEERRKYGGFAFVEVQFCVLPAGTKLKHIVSVDSLQHGRNDSLYIHLDDDDTFYREYGRIFDCGTYGNLQSGAVDLLGVNYYAPESIDPILEKIRREKPLEYETLADWLNAAKAYNGFYILGV